MNIFRGILTLGHLVILALLAGTYLNAYIAPQTLVWVNLLSLLFPVMVILHFLLCCVWIVLRQKKAVFFLSCSILFYNPIKRWINFTEESTEKPNLKIVTMNIKGGSMGREAINEYLANTQADIIFGQECGSEFQIPGYSYKTTDYPIVALNSKTEIIDQGKITMTGNGNSFFADVKFNGKIIRVINLYLNPFSFEKQKVKPAEDLGKNQTKIKYVLHRLLPVFKIHQQEIADIRRAVESSPYPVILAGDFNAVPNSYEYYTLGKGLTDAFMKAGKGSATSFHDYKFPLRIDYIFTSPEIKAVSYKVDRSVHLSDHFPVLAEFNIK